MTRALPLAMGLLAVGSLSCGKRTVGFRHCTDDAECPASQVCFADGCGDLAQGLRVEIIPNTREGLYAQDFNVNTLSVRQDFALAGPSFIQGALLQLANGQVNPSESPYAGSVSVQAVGESSLIPGVVRSFELGSARQSYQLPVGTGSYSVVANAMEDPYPPVQFGSRVTVLMGATVNVDLLFPSADSLLQLSGQLLADHIPFTTVEMQVQAFDPNTQRPLSQRASVSKKAGEAGQFLLRIAPSAHDVAIQVFPKNADAIVPRKSFPVTLPSAPVSLDLGNFGSLVTVSGALRTVSGGPVADASVYIAGTVRGGGSFRSRTVLTDASGSFSLTTLPGASDGPLTLWAFPGTDSSAGVLSTPVTVLDTTALGTLTCPDKVLVTGSLHLPNGNNAPGVRINAEPIASVPGHTLPSNIAHATTDASGAYSLMLNPADYRLDFLPAAPLPRLSRFITISAEAAESGSGFKPVEVPTVSLSNGRRVTGSLFFGGNLSTLSASRASIRFFHLSTDTQAPSSVLLGDTLSDQAGTYSVILPAR